MTKTAFRMPRIASHRGGAREFGDSTPQGFAATARMALEEVEFDVHPTADGAIVVHHDPTLDATTDRSGVIAEMTLAAVREAVIDYSAGGRPLALPELCALYRDSTVDFRCEIKPDVSGRPYRDFAPRVVEALGREGMLARTVFSAFLIPTLDALGAATDRPRLWLVSPPVQRQLGFADVIAVARAHGLAEIGLNIDALDASAMDEAEAAGLAVGAWAAHDAARIDKALALGVKVFTTDRPSLAIARRAAWAAA